MKAEHWSLRQWHWLFLLAIILIVLAHTIDLIVGRPFWTITRAIYLGHESNIPTWISGGILFAGGVYAILCWQTAALKGIGPRFGWLLVAFFLISLSCDEVACLHETVGGKLTTMLAPTITQSMKHTGWPLVLGPIAFAVAIAMGWILYSHLKGAYKAGLLMVAGVAVFLGSAVVLESSINLLNHEELQWLWDIEIIAEEAGEMIGAWLMGLGLITRLEIYRAAAAIGASPQTATLSEASKPVVAVP